MDNKTALQYFIQELSKSIGFRPDSELEIWYNNLVNESLQMEQEQIDHAWNDGFLEGIDGGVTAVAKEYMNRIFGAKDER